MQETSKSEKEKETVRTKEWHVKLCTPTRHETREDDDVEMEEEATRGDVKGNRR